MPIKLEEYDEIFKQMPKRGTGDEIELDEEDERILDKVWKRRSKKIKEKEEQNKS